MARYIDADALQKDGWVLQRYVCEDGCAFIERREIDQIPTIEARPVVRGEWDDRGIYMICPVCGAEFDDDIVNMCLADDKSAVNFCGNCGADMRPKEDANA